MRCWASVVLTKEADAVIELETREHRSRPLTGTTHRMAAGRGAQGGPELEGIGPTHGPEMGTETDPPRGSSSQTFWIPQPHEIPPPSSVPRI